MNRRFLLSLLVFCTSIAAAFSVRAETIILAADEWPPFNAVSGSEREGYIIDIARAVFEAHGYTVDYKVVPWTRALEMTRSGSFDGAVGASKTDAAGFVFPQEELARNRLAFYVRKGEPWRYRGPASIEETTLGTIAGYDYRPWLLSYIEAHKDDPARVQIIHGDEPLKRNLTKLLNDRIQVVVDTEAAIRFVAQEMGVAEQIECAGYGDETAFIYIAFAPDKPRSKLYAELLSQGISEMRRSGRLQQILDRYGLQDWQ